MKKNKRALWWIFQNGKKCIPSICLLTVISISAALLSLKFTDISKTVLDVATGQAEGDFVNACVWLVALLIVHLLLSLATTFVNVHSTAKMDIEMKKNIFSRIINKDYLSVSKYHSGDLLTRLTSDLQIVINGIMTIVPNVSLLLTNIIGGFIMLYRLDSFFALLVLGVGPLILISARVYSSRYKQLHKDCQAASGKVRSFMQETMQNILVIKSFSNQDSVLDHNAKLQKESYRLQIKRTKVSVIAHILMYVAFNASYYFALAYGAYKLSLGLMTYGTITAMLQLVGKIQAPFKNISGLVPQVLSIIASVERILEIEDLKEEPAATGVTVSRDIYEKMNSIEFKNVDFEYDDATKIIHNMNISVKKGEMAVIAGESGSGKSTTVKLMLGILNKNAGEIYMATDDGNIPLGMETRNLFAYVPQGNLILSGTIRENITFACENATDEEIIKAAKIAQIWDFISTLENGLDTELGEKGLGLSEGQLQRLSIARAILYDAPILLLDEATSALDSVTEVNFLNAVKELTDKTCIIVSHKKAAFDMCDKVINFNDFKGNN